MRAGRSGENKRQNMTIPSVTSVHVEQARVERHGSVLCLPALAIAQRGRKRCSQCMVITPVRKESSRAFLGLYKGKPSCRKAVLCTVAVNFD